MSFNPSEPRVPAGAASGGQWGAPTKSRKKTAASSKPKSTAKPTAKLGPARNPAAAKAQQNPQARKLYGQLVQASPAQRAAYVKGLSTDDLKLLTQIAYSSRTSDPDVVNARIAIANEMARRGIDIKQYGALGGGLPPAKVAALKKVAGRRVAMKVAPRKPALASPAPSAKSYSSPMSRPGRATPV